MRKGKSKCNELEHGNVADGHADALGNQLHTGLRISVFFFKHKKKIDNRMNCLHNSFLSYSLCAPLSHRCTPPTSSDLITISTNHRQRSTKPVLHKTTHPTLNSHLRIPTFLSISCLIKSTFSFHSFVATYRRIQRSFCSQPMLHAQTILCAV